MRIDLVFELILVVIIIFVFLNVYKSFKRYENDENTKGDRDFQSNTFIKDDEEEGNESSDKNYFVNSFHSTEYGLIYSLVAKVVHADENVDTLEMNIMEKIKADIVEEIGYRYNDIEKQFEEIFDYEKSNEHNVESIATALMQFIGAEYQKRLKIIEMLFNIAYSDGELENREKEIIIDVAAYFEIENEDFNKIYDSFASFYKGKASSSTELTLDESYKILSLDKKSTDDEIKKKYRELVKKYHPDVISSSRDQDFIKNSAEKLIEINNAYQKIKEDRSFK